MKVFNFSSGMGMGVVAVNVLALSSGEVEPVEGLKMNAFMKCLSSLRSCTTTPEAKPLASDPDDEQAQDQVQDVNKNPMEEVGGDQVKDDLKQELQDAVQAMASSEGTGEAPDGVTGPEGEGHVGQEQGASSINTHSFGFDLPSLVRQFDFNLWRFASPRSIMNSGDLDIVGELGSEKISKVKKFKVSVTGELSLASEPEIPTLVPDVAWVSGVLLDKWLKDSRSPAAHEQQAPMSFKSAEFWGSLTGNKAEQRALSRDSEKRLPARYSYASIWAISFFQTLDKSDPGSLRKRGKLNDLNTEGPQLLNKAKEEVYGVYEREDGSEYKNDHVVIKNMGRFQDFLVNNLDFPSSDRGKTEEVKVADEDEVEQKWLKIVSYDKTGHEIINIMHYRYTANSRETKTMKDVVDAINRFEVYRKKREAFEMDSSKSTEDVDKDVTVTPERIEVGDVYLSKGASSINHRVMESCRFVGHLSVADLLGMYDSASPVLYYYVTAQEEGDAESDSVKVNAITSLAGSESKNDKGGAVKVESSKSESVAQKEVNDSGSPNGISSSMTMTMGSKLTRLSPASFLWPSKKSAANKHGGRFPRISIRKNTPRWSRASKLANHVELLINTGLGPQPQAQNAKVEGIVKASTSIPGSPLAPGFSKPLFVENLRSGFASRSRAADPMDDDDGLSTDSGSSSPSASSFVSSSSSLTAGTQSEVGAGAEPESNLQAPAEDGSEAELAPAPAVVSPAGAVLEAVDAPAPAVAEIRDETPVTGAAPEAVVSPGPAAAETSAAAGGETSVGDKDMYTYEQLKAIASNKMAVPEEEDVDRDHLENSLSVEEFKNVFKMSRAEFNALQPWKKGQEKKKVGLF